MKKTKQLIVGFALVASLAAPSAPSFAAKESPSRGCAATFTPMPVTKVLTIAAPGFEGAIAAADANGDGILCVKILDKVKVYEPTFIYFDNDKPIG